MTSRPSHLQASALQIGEALNGSMMTAARTLREIRDRQSQDLAEVAKRAEISLRKAHALARIATIFDSRGLPNQRLERIGWAKLDILGGHIADDGRNLETLLSLAEQYSQLELKRRLQQGTVPESRHASMLLHLPEAQDRRFRRLLTRFGAKTMGKGLAYKEQALIALMDTIDAMPDRS